MKTTRTLQRILSWACAAALLSAAAGAQTDIEKRVDARADGTVEITNIAGSITVAGWDKTQVEITGTLGRGVKELDVDSSGGRVEIEVEYGRRSHYGGSTVLDIRLPRGSRVIVESVSASVEIVDVDGEVEVESVSGSVLVEGRPQSAEVETVSGKIEVQDAVESVSAESVNGTITVGGGRDIEADAVSGNIYLRGIEDLKRADLGVVSGRIEIEADLAKGADVTASTHSGSIELVLPASVSARFEATSFRGRIRNELGPEARQVGRFTPEQELEFKTGSGDARVRLETFSGRISIRKR